MARVYPVHLYLYIRSSLYRAKFFYSEWRTQEMPSVSAKQARLMAAAAHNRAFAKKVGVPQKVAKEFNQADKGTGILRKKKK